MFRLHNILYLQSPGAIGGSRRGGKVRSHRRNRRRNMDAQRVTHDRQQHKNQCGSNATDDKKPQLCSRQKAL